MAKKLQTPMTTTSGRGHSAQDFTVKLREQVAELHTTSSSSKTMPDLPKLAAVLRRRVGDGSDVKRVTTFCRMLNESGF